MSPGVQVATREKTTSGAPGECRSSATPFASEGWGRREVLADLAGCAAVAFVLTVIFLPYWDDKSFINIAMAFVYLLVISMGMGFSVKCMYLYVHPRLARRWPGSWRGFVLHALMVMGGVAAGGEFAIRVIRWMSGGHAGIDRGAVFQIGLVVSAVITVITISYDRMKERARQGELREQEARQQALRAQLEALQARTQPHFFFNSLNTVASLIGENPELAERALEKLSGLFRYTLASADTSWVRLEEELQAVRAYLEVEGLRFGDRLRSSVEAEPETLLTMVPPLILQPLVENAVLHGVGSRRGGRVEVRASRQGPDLVLRVLDDGPGPEGSQHRGTGTALVTLRERLRLAYGDTAALRAQRVNGDAGGYEVELRLPAGAAS